VKSFTVRGTWWLPEDDARRVPGELRLSSEEFSLVLDGALLDGPEPVSGMSFRSFFEPVSRPVLLGRTSDWEKFTLLDCSGQVPLIPGEAKATTWIPTAALRGVHLAPDEANFDIVQIHHEDLHVWSGGGGIQQTIATEEGSSRISSITLAAREQALASIEVDGARIQLISAPAFSASDVEGSLRMDTVWRVQVNAPMPWRSMLSQWVIPLRELVSFAVMRPADIKEVSLHVASGNQYTWGTLLLRLLELDREDRPRRRRIRQEMLFTSARLPGGVEEGVARWLA